MKKFFWIGRDAKDGSVESAGSSADRSDERRKRIAIVTPGAPKEARRAKASATKRTTSTTTARSTAEASATKATRAGSDAVVTPAPRASRSDDDTRPTRFSSAPPPPPPPREEAPPEAPAQSPSSSPPPGDVRLVVTCLACAAKNRVPAARLADRSRCARCQEPLTPVGHVLPVEAEAVIDAFATSTTPLLVWLGAAWSGPSSLLGIELDKLATELRGRLVVVRVDVDHRPNLARRFLVESVPTLVLLRRGREEGREVGVLPAKVLRQRFAL